MSQDWQEGDSELRCLGKILVYIRDVWRTGCWSMFSDSAIVERMTEKRCDWISSNTDSRHPECSLFPSFKAKASGALRF